jgi:hypothetical protein
MSIAGMRDGWGRLADRVHDFYGEVREPLLAGIPISPNVAAPLQGLTEEILESSAAIRSEGADALSGASQPDYGRAAELLLAVASIDALLATDLAALAPPGTPGGPLELNEEAEVTSREAGLEEGLQLIAEVDDLFRGLAQVTGAAPADPEPAQLVAEARDAAVQLTKCAAVPGDTLARGFIAAASLGAIPAFEVLSQMHVLTQLPEAGGLRARALGFVRQYAGKLRELLPSDWVFDTIAMQFEARVSVSALLAKAAGLDAANRFVYERIMNAEPPPDAHRADLLRAALTELCDGYQGHTVWLHKGARRLRFFGGAVVHVAVVLLGPAGYCVMPAVFLLGEGYVTYSLADRIDARRLGPADRVEGIVRIVRRLV